MYKESDVEKIDFDKQEVDQKSLASYQQASKSVKSTTAKEAGIKSTENDDLVLLTNNGVDEDGNIDVQVKNTKKDSAFVEIKRRGEPLKHLKQYFQDHGKALVLGIVFIILVMLNLRTMFNFYLTLKTLDISFTYFENIIYELTIMILPMILWFYSTNYTVFNFRRRKLMMFNMSYIFFNFAFIRLTFIFAYLISTPFISRIPITAEMTAGKIVATIYVTTFVPMILVIALLLTIASRSTILHKDFIQKMSEFRLFKVVDSERFSKYEYTYKVVRNIETGKYITIPQKDRQMHTVIIGATGTAKTSSVLLPAIYQDLIVRIRNKNGMKAALWKYTKKGLLRIKKPFEDIDFSPDLFEVNPDYKVPFLHRIIGRTPERILSHIIGKFEIAGQTILAPEESLTDDAYDLFTSYGEKCNRVDPVLVEGKLKEGFKGMNILYISSSFPDWKLDRERVRRSTLLSDVMQIMFEMGGKSDPYFASVNRIATTTVALLLQLTYPTLKGRQPNLVDVRDGLNDFKMLREPFDILFPNKRITPANEKWRWLKDNLMNFFLGEGAETFEQHARGLKVQFSSFLADDYIRNLVAADDVIDFDEILANNDLTVVNIELPEIGPINSPALGLFFTVNMSNAVLRRPGNENTRVFHTWRIDEFPIVVTPSMEQAFTLFRKFKVAMEVAMQTLDQMEKTPFLKYLAGVITNSTANQIFFGRASLSEMELVSKLSGTVEDAVDMEGTSETSLFARDPSMSTMKRKTVAVANVVEEAHVRFRDFQEVMYITTKRGTLMPTVHGKVEFLKRKHKRGPRKIKRRNWAKLYESTSKDLINNVPENKKKPNLALSSHQINTLIEENEKNKIDPRTIYINESETPEVTIIETITNNNVTETNDEVSVNASTPNKLSESNSPKITVSNDEHVNEKVSSKTVLSFDFEEEADVINESKLEESIKIDPYEAKVIEQTKEAPPLNSKEARKMKLDGYENYLE